MKSSSSAISFNARPLVISIHQTEKIAVRVVCVCVCVCERKRERERFSEEKSRASFKEGDGFLTW